MPSSSQISPPVLTKRRLGLAGVAAVFGCVACCAMPLLAAAGLGSGIIAALSSVFSPGNELMVGGAFFVVALGAMVIRARSKKSNALACGTTCSVDGSCCEPTAARRSA